MRGYLMTLAAMGLCLSVASRVNAKPPPPKGPQCYFPKYGYCGKNWCYPGCYPGYGCRWAYRCYLTQYASYIYWDPIECRWYIWYPLWGRYIPYTQYVMLVTPTLVTPPPDLAAPATIQSAQ